MQYDNSLCLSCHKNADPGYSVKNPEEGDSEELHKWLPELEKHLENVRCIDCHTKVNTDILVAHLVLPEVGSVRNCSECHFSNSLLLTTLYKNQVPDTLKKNGMLNAMVNGDIFVLGANRNRFLNLLSLVIIGFVLAGIILHTVPRIIEKNQ